MVVVVDVSSELVVGLAVEVVAGAVLVVMPADVVGCKVVVVSAPVLVVD